MRGAGLCARALAPSLVLVLVLAVPVPWVIKAGGKPQG